MRKSLWTIPILLLFVAIGAPAAHAGSTKYNATFACVPACSLLPVVTNNPVSFPSPYDLGVNWDGAAFFFVLNSGDAPGNLWAWTALSSDDTAVFQLFDLSTDDAYLQNATVSSSFNSLNGNLTFKPVVNSTPEPSSLLLFGTSLLGLVPFRRKLFGR
jgi:hypothetical protein